MGTPEAARGSATAAAILHSVYTPMPLKSETRKLQVIWTSYILKKRIIVYGIVRSESMKHLFEM
jgi:hypothetical protein